MPGFEGPLVPECPVVESQGRLYECGCGIAEFLELAQNIINLSIYLAVLVFVLILMYVGLLLVTNFTNPNKIRQARRTAMAAVIGFVIVLSAFLIVDVIMKTFAGDDDWSNIIGSTTSRCSVNVPPDLPPPEVVPGDGPGIAALNALYLVARDNGLEAVYEVEDSAMVSILRNEGYQGAIIPVSGITAAHFSVYLPGTNGVGYEGDTPPAPSCANCVPVQDVACKYPDRCEVNEQLMIGLKGMDEDLEIIGERDGVDVRWRVTEAFPPTPGVTHRSLCHYEGTCVDANLVR